MNQYETTNLKSHWAMISWSFQSNHPNLWSIFKHFTCRPFLQSLRRFWDVCLKIATFILPNPSRRERQMWKQIMVSKRWSRCHQQQGKKGNRAVHWIVCLVCQTDQNFCPDWDRFWRQIQIQKHRHRQNVTSYHFFDKITFITKGKIHKKKTEKTYYKC